MTNLERVARDVDKQVSEMTDAEFLTHLATVDVPRDIHPLIQRQVSERLLRIAAALKELKAPAVERAKGGG